MINTILVILVGWVLASVPIGLIVAYIFRKSDRSPSPKVNARPTVAWPTEGREVIQPVAQDSDEPPLQKQRLVEKGTTNSYLN